jgi:Flp pilus assembly protein TadD
MGRKTLVASILAVVLLLTVASPRMAVLGAWGSPADTDVSQPAPVNNLGRVLGAPFRALGKLFGGGKKNKPISKITDKDIKKFETFEVKRVKDAKNPPVVKTEAAPAAGTGAAPVTPGNPENNEAVFAEHVRKGREFLNAGQLNEAISELTRATSIKPTSGEAQMLLGVAYDRKGLGSRARDAFETALHAPDDKAMHLNNLGFLLYRQGEFNEAIKYLKKAAKLNPADNRIWNNLTTAQLAAGKFDDAYKSSAQVLGEFESRLKIAKRLEWRGHTKEAIKYLEKAQALQPGSAEVLSQLATLYTTTGQQEKADKARQALTVANASTQK